MASRQTYSLDEIKDRLLAQLDSVVSHYAPAVAGSHTQHGIYWTLNPGRPDRNVGSFCIHVSGSKAGRWNDYATGSHGDVLDLIDLALHGEGSSNLSGAIKEARAWLGLDTESPELRRKREQRAAEAAKARALADAAAEQKRERRQRLAQGIWLSGHEALRGTPVDHYLRAERGIDLASLGRQPGALRYVPQARYQYIDDKTGEVTEGTYPMMAAAITDLQGRFVAVHRTYLAREDGRWIKAPVPKPRLVLGHAWQCGINIWRGADTGPRGGRAPSLPACAPGTHVYITEGIEDALSVVMLLPDVRVVAAISLSNMGAIRLPENVARVTLVADRDPHPEQKEQLRRAIEAHCKAGREVRLWQNRYGGKDLNDALRQAADKAPPKETADEE